MVRVQYECMSCTHLHTYIHIILFLLIYILFIFLFIQYTVKLCYVLLPPLYAYFYFFLLVFNFLIFDKTCQSWYVPFLSPVQRRVHPEFLERTKPSLATANGFLREKEQPTRT